MDIVYLPKFARQYKKLSLQIKERAEDKEKIFRRNPFDPRLKTHKLTGLLKGFFAFSVDHSYRIIFDFSDTQTARFYEIGDHDIY